MRAAKEKPPDPFPLVLCADRKRDRDLGKIKDVTCCSCGRGSCEAMMAAGSKEVVSALRSLMQAEGLAALVVPSEGNQCHGSYHAVA